MMTVAALIQLLQEEDPGRLVIIAKDPEGNGFSPLYHLFTASYRADSTYSGEIGLEELTDEDRDEGYDEDDVIEDGVPAVVLVPTN